MIGNCKHCDEEFEQRRSNHLYCKDGCKTMASYKRNNYTYVSGSYRRNDETDLVIIQKDHSNIKQIENINIEKHLKVLTKKVEHIENEISNGFMNTLKAVFAVEGIKELGKRFFGASFMQFTKSDGQNLERRLDNLEFKNDQILAILNEQSKQKDLENSFL